MARKLQPVEVLVAPPAAAELLHELLLDYQATLTPGEEMSTVSMEPVDTQRRGTVIYRAIQASRTVAERFPDAVMQLVTEDGSKWHLPPPAL